MYGLWLYKEVKTPYGYARVEIHQKGYEGNAIEIEALAADSIVLSVSNLSEVAAPLQKSQLSFSIIDTNQFDYSLFFTPDARKYKVILSTKVEGSEYVQRWSGFLTPDSYIEDLQYRSTIDLIARDNIGLLNDYQFDYIPADATNNVDSIRNIILAGFRKISDPYPMELLFRTKKTSVGSDDQELILAVDCIVNCYQMYGKTWGEVLETLLHDMALQLRYIDNNTLAIYDLSQLSDLAGDSTPQELHFLGASGVREVQPAWRDFYIEQNYGIIDDFYVGNVDTEEKLTYIKESAYNRNIGLYEPTQATHWSRQGDIYILNLHNVLNSYVDDNKAKSIYITGCKPDVSDAEVANTKLTYSQRINAINKQITISFALNDTLREPSSTVYSRGGQGKSIFYLPYQQINRVTRPLVYQLKYRFNVYLLGDDGKTYIMREEWVELPADLDAPFIEFTTDKLKSYYTNVITSGGSAAEKFTQYNNQKDYSIVINGIPVSGVLQFVVYPYTFVDDSYADVRDINAYERGAKIADLTFKVETETRGIKSHLSINAEHNIKADDAFTYGEVPRGQGDFLLYTGGLFYPETLVSVNGFRLPDRGDGSQYQLLELVCREIAHYNRTNYNMLSGDCYLPDNAPLTFASHFTRDGKKYLMLESSLNIIRNDISVTRMTEVEPYQDVDYTQISSAISVGSSVSMSGGNNTVMQFSAKVGNAKRIYELDTATEADYDGSYIVIDKPAMNEAKKLSVKNIVGQSEWFEERISPSGQKYLYTDMTIATRGDVVAGSTSDVEVPSAGGGEGLKYAVERTAYPTKFVYPDSKDEIYAITAEERAYNIETFNKYFIENAPIFLNVDGVFLYLDDAGYNSNNNTGYISFYVLAYLSGALLKVSVVLNEKGDAEIHQEYIETGSGGDSESCIPLCRDFSDDFNNDFAR